MAELSGPAWCARFPTSTSLDDLLPVFGDRVRAFLDRLAQAGARTIINATYRPPQRAYLMHWCSMVGANGQDPAAVPPMDGVEIDWTHGGDTPKARAGARRMMARYHIAFPAALVSRHTQRRAVDMTIRWKDALRIIGSDGKGHLIEDGPRSGSNRQLIDVGAGFGVIKLKKDPPHWSDDGH
jgi:D-alanyl-D-alanine dipeptidase